MRFIFLLALTFFMITVPAVTQNTAAAAKPSADKQERGRDPARQDEIIVRGQGEVPDERVRNTTVLGGLLRSADEYATRFARCAKGVQLDLLRKIIDGEPNSSPFIYALDRAIRMNSGCYMGFASSFTADEPALGECNKTTNDSPPPGFSVCRAPYDRAALLAEAMQRYAPDAVLGEDDTRNPAVLQRLGARERQRNRLRLPSDKIYFGVAICMVGAQPRLATDIVQAYGDTALQIRLSRRMVDTTPQCTGNATSIVFDALEFRNYVADAFYRWVVAARNVSSLLPSPGQGSKE